MVWLQVLQRHIIIYHRNIHSNMSRDLVQAYSVTRKIQLKQKRSTYSGHFESDDCVFASKICKPSNLTVAGSTFIQLMFFLQD